MEDITLYKFMRSGVPEHPFATNNGKEWNRYQWLGYGDLLVCYCDYNEEFDDFSVSSALVYRCRDMLGENAILLTGKTFEHAQIGLQSFDIQVLNDVFDRLNDS